MSPSIYGYWIGQDEIYDVLSVHGHEEIALEILVNVHDLLQKNIGSNTYNLMFYLGYIRIVNEGGGHKAQHWKDAKYSKLQKQFLKEASNLDEWSIHDWEMDQIKHILHHT